MADTAFCELIKNDSINEDIFRLDFVWPGVKPKAGQFFMIKPKQSAVFLARPISVAAFPAETMESNTRVVQKLQFLNNFLIKTAVLQTVGRKTARLVRQPTGLSNKSTVRFLIARRGKGTLELAAMRAGDQAELIGPLGNAWTDFLAAVENGSGKPIALVGGGIGIAPLQALLYEESKWSFDFYAGFKKDLKTKEKDTLLGAVYLKASNIIIAAENGTEGHKGLIPDFLEPEKYAAVCACGPQPMLKTVAAKCAAAGVPCFISMERRMACGTGACLGCTVKTVNGNRRCCTDGPIFKANEVIFDDQ